MIKSDLDYRNLRIAYFSAEIGVSEQIPTYSGGLGILAGDHLKSAADLEIPLCAVTLLYRQGYFQQQINAQGEQVEQYPVFQAEEHLQRLEVKFSLPLAGRRVHLRAWRYDVQGLTGAVVPLFFLDTDLPENSRSDRALTDRLYSGGETVRLAQEALLGFGGVQLLRLLGINGLQTYHLNEGHTAFVPLALGTELQEMKAARDKCVFTTHTPIPAGHDRFPRSEVEALLGPLAGESSVVRFNGQVVNMTELALENCRAANGVSQVHARVSREMFPGRSIFAVTNGVHHLTWTGPATQALFDRHLPGWREHPLRLEQAADIPADSLWAAHQANKIQLLDHIRERSQTTLDREMLTIGFARRAAEYKRALLLLTDSERLIAICGGRAQFLFAGKAHPADSAGKAIIRDIVQAARRLAGRLEIIFLENYQMELGRLLTAGVDVWLNTPRKPMEASGTSGMKAALNGVLNLSVLDGWWAEGCRDGINGWAINGTGDSGDAADAERLYQLLERQVVPTYYDRRRHWLEMMQESIKTGARFTSQRMLREYCDLYYKCELRK